MWQHKLYGAHDWPTPHNLVWSYGSHVPGTAGVRPDGQMMRFDSTVQANQTHRQCVHPDLTDSPEAARSCQVRPAGQAELVRLTPCRLQPGSKPAECFLAAQR